jgi:aryl-alcohol dehydrogenase-like predicted oxidoreductase
MLEDNMQRRKLGSQGLAVSALGLGAMGMSGVPGMPALYGVTDEAESIATLHRALELGIDFIDTAEFYGPFTNESLLGKAFAGRRDEVSIATKFAFEFDADGKPLKLNSSPAHIKKSLEGSLKRLGVDCIDLWYQHRVDPAVPIEETVGAMGEMVQAGKVRFLGLSEASAATVRRAHATFPISALQSEYSIWERGVEQDILPAIRELGIGFVPYSPLGRGFLTGVAKPASAYPEGDYRKLDPRFQDENYAANQRIADEVARIAAARNATPAQIALAWLLAQGEDMVPIPGTKRRTYLEQNAAAVELKLTADELAELGQAAPVGATAGPRYQPTSLRMLDSMNKAEQAG